MDKEDVVHGYTMDYYSAVKKKKRMPFAATWMDLEMIILGKVSQTENLYVGYKIWHRASLVVWW